MYVIIGLETVESSALQDWKYIDYKTNTIHRYIFHYRFVKCCTLIYIILFLEAKISGKYIL